MGGQIRRGRIWRFCRVVNFAFARLGICNMVLF